MALLLALGLAWPVRGYAVEISDRLSLNGFYSLDASLSLGDDTVLPSRSGGIILEDDEPSLDYSLIGLQADLSLSDNLRLTAQAVSSKQTDEDLSPTLEWAYLSYDLGHDISLRGGKLKTPVLQGIELRHVGFSRLWIRPLIPASGAAGFDEYHGVEIIKQHSQGDYNFKFQGAYGVADHDKKFVDNRDIKVISARIERDESWLNLALMHARYDVYTHDMARTLQKGAEVYLASLEGEVLWNDAVINFGYSGSHADLNPDERLAYLSLGYRLNRLTPYLLYQYREMDYPAARLLPPPPGPPPPGAIPPPPVKDGDFTTRGISLGLRYDLDANHAIKAQVERLFLKDATYRSLDTVEHASTVLSITLEGVF